MTKGKFVDANGLRFEVFEAGDPGSDRFAICLHGFPESAHSWRYQMPMLAEQGYCVWAPNLRGYGQSSKPPGVAAYRTDVLADDVAALVRARGAQHPNAEVLLLGHDWGAAIAWLVAFRYKALIDRLVIMNVPHPAVFARVLRDNTEQRKASWYMAFFQMPGLPEAILRRNDADRLRSMFRRSSANPGTFTEADVDAFAKSFQIPGAATAMINYYRAALRYRRSTTEVGRIEVPTLMLWGDADTALIKETTYGTEAFVTDLTLRYLPGVSHWVQQDAPDDVNAMLGAWLRGEPVPEAADASRA